MNKMKNESNVINMAKANTEAIRKRHNSSSKNDYNDYNKNTVP